MRLLLLPAKYYQEWQVNSPAWCAQQIRLTHIRHPAPFKMRAHYPSSMHILYMMQIIYPLYNYHHLDSSRHIFAPQNDRAVFYTNIYSRSTHELTPNI
jgi:hypothetical protein